MFGLSFLKLSLVLIVILLLFGGGRLPDLGRGLGKAIRALRRSHSENGEIGKSGNEDGKR